MESYRTAFVGIRQPVVAAALAALLEGDGVGVRTASFSRGGLLQQVRRSQPDWVFVGYGSDEDGSAVQARRLVVELLEPGPCPQAIVLVAPDTVTLFTSSNPAHKLVNPTFRRLVDQLHHLLD